MNYLRKLKYVLICGALIMVVSCNLEGGPYVALETADLVDTCWIHSQEEDIPPNDKVYRPCDYTNFAPSPFRGMFTFMEDGLCEYLVLAPNDAHYFEMGRWEYYESSRILRIWNNENESIAEHEVLGFEEDKLTLK